MTRCKVSDVAIIRGGNPEPYVNRMVEVMTAVGPIGLDAARSLGFLWVVKPLGWHPGEGLGETFWFPDDRLTPIRDNPGTDETIQWAGKPNEVNHV